jgi:hypothetical protein
MLLLRAQEHKPSLQRNTNNGEKEIKELEGLEKGNVNSTHVSVDSEKLQTQRAKKMCGDQTEITMD